MERAHTSLATYCRVQLAASPAKSAVLGLLIVVALIVVTVQFGGGPSPARATVPPDGVADLGLILPPGPAGAVAPSPAPGKRRPLPPMTTRLKRDLFAAEWYHAPEPDPETAQAGDAEQAARPDVVPLALEATYLSGDAPLAVINGRLVPEGAPVQGYVVERIEGRHVVVRRGDERRVLWMP